MWRRRHIAVRSWRRVVGLGSVGLTATAIWPLSGDLVSSLVVVPLGLFAVAYAWWPRLLVTESAVEVRNLRTRRVHWQDVERIITADQVPNLPRVWRSLNRWFGRGGVKDVGYLGLCVTSRHGVVPVIALQAVSPWWNLRRTSPGWLVGIERRLRSTLQAARSGRSAVDAYRASRGMPESD